MDMRIEESQETELNMTPMIDIVFQLIIFFLLSLKFKTVDRRIDSMLPKKEGLDPTPRFVEDDLKIKFKLFRRDMVSEDGAYTLIRLDNARQFTLPKGWKGRSAESRARISEYDAVMASIRKAIDERVARYGGIASGVKGEIAAPPPTGGSVPHGDAIALLDTFLKAGLQDVKFEGTQRPLSRSEREARAAGR